MFLERVKDDFKQCYAENINNEEHPLVDYDDNALFKDRFSIAYNLDRDFGCVSFWLDYEFIVICCHAYDLMLYAFLLTRRLKEHMQYCMEVPCVPISIHDSPGPRFML
ncbi:hypothetical protein LINPERPRIM_LOCUS9867 [Linum perenne]